MVNPRLAPPTAPPESARADVETSSRLRLTNSATTPPAGRPSASLRFTNSATTRPDGAFVARLLNDVDAWAAGRNWIVRAPLLVFLAYVGVRQFGDAEYASVFGAINLGIHEAGHFVFKPLGDVLHVAGGSLLQCLAPIAALVMFVRRPDWFAVAVCLGWLSTNLHHVGTYMADADEMRLPLVTVGAAESVTHDFRFLFERFDVLHRCEAIAAFTHGAAHATMAAAVLGGAWVLARMARARR